MALATDNLVKWGEERGYTVLPGNLVTLHAGNLDISVIFEPAGATYNSNGGYTVSVVADKDTWDKEKQKQLKKEVKRVGTLFYTQQTGLVQVRIGVSGIWKNSLFSRLDKAVEALSTVLPELGVKQSDRCHYCGEPGCNSQIQQSGALLPAHSACKQAHMDQVLTEIAANQANGNYPLAILCALVGGIVGMLPSVIGLYVFNYVHALFYILIPMGAGFGYRLGRGVRNKVMPLVVALISLVCAVAVDLTVVYLDLFEYYGYIAPGEFFEFILLPDVLVDLLPEFLVSAFFVIIGIMCSWRYISGTNSRKKKELQTLQLQTGGQDNEP